jgi:OOP family OmpA-OmpF porin
MVVGTGKTTFNDHGITQKELEMKATHKALVLLLMLVSITVPQAQAEVQDEGKPLVSLTPYVGWGLWSQDLGVEDSMVYGGRGAIHFLRWLSLEGTYGMSSGDRETDAVGVDLTHYGVDLVADLMPSRKVTPYITAGWAQFDYEAEDDGISRALNGGEFGAGIKAKLWGDNANHRALRLELRDVMTDLTPDFPNDGGWTHNLIASAGLQFAFGKSSKDTDGDGVLDKHDACPDTPKGAVVDATGCPVDSDGDGVYDGLDSCEDTPRGATVDSYGCPSDSDGDGVLDGLDTCANTPTGAMVDRKGCPLDSDQDGVFDGLDQCPDTDTNLQVDINGCPIAVTDTEVQLLDTGTISTNKVVFATSSADLDMGDTAVLQEIGETLSRWPELKLEIGGHTDSSGSAAFNQKLSQQRAQSVLDYLTANYPEIDTTQYTVVGYGEENPVANNETVEGRAANRRVEFKVLNPDDLKRVIEKRRMLER